MSDLVRIHIVGFLTSRLICKCHEEICLIEETVVYWFGIFVCQSSSFASIKLYMYMGESLANSHFSSTFVSYPGMLVQNVWEIFAASSRHISHYGGRQSKPSLIKLAFQCFLIQWTLQFLYKATHYNVIFLKWGQNKTPNVAIHYPNMSQYAATFHSCKNGNCQMKKCDIFLIFAENIDHGYTLEPPHWGGSKEYPWSMF